ncbi:MAG: radical SAM protein [Carboxylicivirga sp.]|jgi:hypothetical protein|nr:radical SAM protein [Carboxylicivirga sp.]
MTKVLLLTPPFTQLNTPYPATAYLKGFLNTLNLESKQFDLGIATINRLFSKQGLCSLFELVDESKIESANAHRIYILKEEYISSIERVMFFLKEPTVLEAQNICHGQLLPEASRFSQLDDEEVAFGEMGLIDRAKHHCTLFLEDLSDFIIEVMDANFGFSRYAERLGRSASSFDQLYTQLKMPVSFIEQLMFEELELQVLALKPNLVTVSIPFPGNLLGALRIGQWLKKNHPDIVISWGGGFVNTELRSLRDERVFEFCDFVTLDDGERPLQCLLEHVQGQRLLEQLKRTFTCIDHQVVYYDGALEKDIEQNELPAPDYSDVQWNQYISVLEVANPMFRLWSDGRWVKLTLAHGCYWGKCTFCDGSLDYIKRYEPSKVSILVDRIEAIIKETGKRGFHFVDEAASPALLKELAIELLRRELKIVWWTNIRFEHKFTADLCRLLKESGCIAVAGGLEVASERILKLINKGVTLEMVSNVASNLSSAGILVHAYLMYGFPSQSDQETIDSLEVVRQMFELGIVESGFWHQFALTAHSPVGLSPQKFNVEVTDGLDGAFANNDLQFVDLKGCDHSRYSEGLRKAMYNYMHGVAFDYPLNEWFDFKVPRTSLPPNYIVSMITNNQRLNAKNQLLWLAHQPLVKEVIKQKGKKQKTMLQLNLISRKSQNEILVKKALGEWLCKVIERIDPKKNQSISFAAFQSGYEENNLGDFEKFINSYTFSQLCEAGLLIL